MAVDIRSGRPVIEYDEREIDDPDGVGLPNDAAAIDMREELSTISSAARVLRRAVRAMGAIMVPKGMEMCQQWFSVAGLVLDVVGFLIIAFEWRHTYLHSVFLRETQVQEDHDRTKAR